MDFLTLCQHTRRECRIAGSGPSTVTGQAGLLEDVVEWTAQAWTEIQNRHRWRWLRRDWTFDTTATDDTYEYGDVTDVDAAAVITRFGDWRMDDPEDPPKIYKTADGVAGQRWLVHIEWEHFKAIYKIGSQVDSAPVHITEDPQQRIVIGPAPNDTYTITGDYWRSAQLLAADGDTPEMPEQYHMLIPYYAMTKYGFTEVAEEILQRGSVEASRLMRQLENNQMPRVVLAEAMA